MDLMIMIQGFTVGYELRGLDTFHRILERYTGRYYVASIRFCKLHGSLNYSMVPRDTKYIDYRTS